MRSDMAKVIVERPRKRRWAWNKPKGLQRRLNRLLGEGPPIREGMKARWQKHTKIFNEHLGPLRRYLDSQVGRPWDKVFAEISPHINRNSVVQDHVRDHVDGYVATHIVLIDGVPCSGKERFYGQPISELPWIGWYVCPRTGLLRKNASFRRYKKKAPKPPAATAPVRVSDHLQCHFVEGAWHLVTLEPLPALLASDVLLRRPAKEIPAEEARKRYGAAVYAAAKRRLSRRELRNYPIPVDVWK